MLEQPHKVCVSPHLDDVCGQGLAFNGHGLPNGRPAEGFHQLDDDSEWKVVKSVLQLLEDKNAVLAVHW